MLTMNPFNNRVYVIVQFLQLMFVTRAIVKNICYYMNIIKFKDKQLGSANQKYI